MAYKTNPTFNYNKGVSATNQLFVPKLPEAPQIRINVHNAIYSGHPTYSKKEMTCVLTLITVGCLAGGVALIVEGGGDTGMTAAGCVLIGFSILSCGCYISNKRMDERTQALLANLRRG